MAVDLAPVAPQRRIGLEAALHEVQADQGQLDVRRDHIVALVVLPDDRILGLLVKGVTSREHLVKKIPSIPYVALVRVGVPANHFRSHHDGSAAHRLHLVLKVPNLLG